MTTTPTLALWRRLSALPGGNRLFSAAIALRVPYFGTILPTVHEMQPGRCVVTAPKWFGVYNHIRTFHAIAACNLAELAMGMLAEATVPPTHRWLPKAMSVEYVAKATTGLRAVAELDHVPAFGDHATDVEVPVTVYDKHGTPVVTGAITVWVAPRS
ncbi:hotdog fold domain-containing protein [Haloechinothrix sp. LS1_15]|uniref:hotdog fold domain-containing protein n=1 Tax=Haloechinothrix sp. LS1_15 TaxID=2652248 RepID=UPI002947ADB3|nr:hotdog fold domain-containing protein [Haloechinothrix sp. LS1_15]MDV6011593.1 DUF4442 domain-containing protein [Haloechinothrix sp. LS1_15]